MKLARLPLNPMEVKGFKYPSMPKQKKKKKSKKLPKNKKKSISQAKITKRTFQDGNYAKYLASHKWIVRREAFKRVYRGLFGEYCYTCTNEASVVHHITYKRVTNEKDSDLMYLCADCHHELHTVDKRVTMATALFLEIRCKDLNEYIKLLTK